MPYHFMSKHMFINGKKSNENRFPFSFPEDHIFVFESLKCYGNVIFRLGEHLDRLFESAHTTGIKLSRTREEFKRELTHILEETDSKDIFLRLMVDEKNTYVFILERKRPASIYEEGVDLKTAVTRRHFPKAESPEAKTNAFLNNVFATMEKECSPAFDFIFLDESGYITEATIWNVFMVKSGIVMTPEQGVLRGVTRQFVIECAAKEHLPVKESNFTRHDFWNADEAFLTNTSGEIVPVRSLDGRTVGSEIPGLITKRLMNRFQKELKQELMHGH